MAQYSAPPIFSVASEKGRRSTMEDSHDIRTNFMEFPLDPTHIHNVIPIQLQHLDSQKTNSIKSLIHAASMSRSQSTKESTVLPDGEALISKMTVETFHLFSVFDGHGGYKAAEHCTEVLAKNVKAQITRALKKYALPIKEILRHNTVPTHVLLSEAINLKDLTSESDRDEEEEAESQITTNELSITPISQTDNILEEDEEEEEDESNAENRHLFSTMSLGLSRKVHCSDQTRSLKSLISKNSETDLADYGLTSDQLVTCFNDAFVATDHQFDRCGGKDESGSTAIVAMISNSLLCFSHCGDCRGVLYRDGQVIQVTREHSPSSTDEQDRIALLGGYVITGRSDTPRVMGVLAMTRSIGDFGLRPYIIPNPETTIVRRSQGDEFIVLASDGLWGFLINQEVCELVKKCFERVESRGLNRHTASKLATHVLIKRAIEKGSPDNITVFVIDLRQHC